MTKTKLAEAKQEMRVQMYKAAVELLGRGYTPDYYESAASEFIQIAEWYMDSVRKGPNGNP